MGFVEAYTAQGRPFDWSIAMFDARLCSHVCMFNTSLCCVGDCSAIFH